MKIYNLSVRGSNVILKKAIEVTNEDLNISNDTSQILIELFVKVLADFCANVEEKLFND